VQVRTNAGTHGWLHDVNQDLFVEDAGEATARFNDRFDADAGDNIEVDLGTPSQPEEAVPSVEGPKLGNTDDVGFVDVVLDYTLPGGPT
jgi:hypothetical protein